MMRGLCKEMLTWPVHDAVTQSGMLKGSSSGQGMLKGIRQRPCQMTWPYLVSRKQPHL